MNSKAVTLSLIMAILAVFFVQSYVSSIEEETRKKFGTEVLVLKAKRDIKEEETLNSTMVEWSLVPKKFLEPSAVSFDKKKEDEETAKAMSQLLAIALVPIKKGEQITQNKIIEPSVRTGLAPQVAPGRRAVSVPVNETTAVGKLVKPGDRVDVIAVIDGGGGKDNKIAKTILQDVVVLAVGRNVSNNVARVVETDSVSKAEKIRSLSEDTTFATVTLEVEPAQAQTIALFSGNDSVLTLSLRNNDDTDRPSVTAVMMGDVLGPDSQRIQTRSPAGRR